MTAIKPMADKLLDGSIPEPNSGCWLWTRCLSRYGYGKVSSGKRGRPTAAHRESFQAFKGPIPEGLSVLHRCDVRCCVNPDHLFVGTKKENSEDMVRKGRSPRGEKQGQSRLTAPDVRLIRRSAEPVMVLARRYGVSHATIIRARAGDCWKHIPL